MTKETDGKIRCCNPLCNPLPFPPIPFSTFLLLVLGFLNREVGIAGPISSSSNGLRAVMLSLANNFLTSWCCWEVGSQV